MAQDLGAPDSPPQVLRGETGSVAPKILVNTSMSEGPLLKEPRTTQENLMDPKFQALLLEKYIEVRRGWKDGMVSPNGINMADLEEETLSKMEADEKAQSEQKAKEEKLRIQAEEAGIPREEEERQGLNERIKNAIWGERVGDPKDIKGWKLTRLVQEMPYKDEYKRNFPGGNRGSSAYEPSIMESSGFSMFDKNSGHVPSLEKVRTFADRVSALRVELEKDAPDFQKVDNLYSEFLSERIEHFFATIHQRVVRTADSYHKYLQKEETRDEFGPPSLASLVEDINRTMNEGGRADRRMLDQLHTQAKKVMEGSGFKSSKLAFIGDQLSDFTHNTLLGGEGVFYDDTLSVDPVEQERLVVHEQLTLEYRALQKSKAQTA